jgi:superfamily II DNA or RNA helicase
MLNATAKNKKRGLMLVRGRHLVDQTSERLLRDGVEHGVIMAGHKLYNPSAPIQICSIDTLTSRKIFPDADFIVVDEAHLATSKSFVEFLSHYKDKYILGVTATPFVDKSLRHIADKAVEPISAKELIEQKYLVPLKHFAPFSPNLKKVKTVAGDFDNEQLEEVMSKLVGDTVAEWTKHAQNKPTIVFAVNIKHSLKIKESFLNAGIACEHVEAETPLEQRKALIRNLKDGRLKVITNVGILCTGVDMPFLECIVMARPTKSCNLYIQQIGRGTRLSVGKSHCLILDHASNTLRHGFITDKRDFSLDGKKAKTSFEAPTTCEKCYHVWYKSQDGPTCPSCGHALDPEKAKRKIEVVDGELVEIKELSTLDQARQDFKKWKKEAKSKGYKNGWAYYKLVTKYGSEVAAIVSPKKVVPPWLVRRT